MRFLLPLTLALLSLLSPNLSMAGTGLKLGFLGNGIRDGALLAGKDLEGKGVSLTLIFEDNAGELARSAAIASELINLQKVDALVSIISGVGKLLKPIAEKAKVINVGICSDTDVASGQFSYINYLTAEQGVSKYLDYFSRYFPAGHSLGVFSMNEAGFQKIVDQLSRKARGRVEVKFIEGFDKGITDFRSILLRAGRRKADVFLILGLSPEIELLARQAGNLRMNNPITSIEAFGLASDKSPFEGAWFIDSAVPSPEFRERFRTVYGREVTPGVGHSYDTVMLLANAAERCAWRNGACSPEQLAQALREIKDFSGSTGVVSVRNDGVIWTEASVKIIRNGTAELVAP